MMSKGVIKFDMDRIYTPAQFADVLGVNVNSIIHLVESDEIPYKIIDDQIFIPGIAGHLLFTKEIGYTQTRQAIEVELEIKRRYSSSIAVPKQGGGIIGFPEQPNR